VALNYLEACLSLLISCSRLL